MSLYGKFNTDHNGTLTVSQDGISTLFDFSSDIYSGVMRLICVSDNVPVSIGIPVPKGGVMRLTRRFSKNALSKMSLDNIDSVILFPASQQYTPAKAAASGPAQSPFHDEAPSVPTAARENAPSAPLPVMPRSDVPPGWIHEPEPEKYFSDPLLREGCRECDGVLMSKEEDIIHLAFPYSREKPFPLITAFRFGHLAQLGNGEYIVFRIKGGNFI